MWDDTIRKITGRRTTIHGRVYGVEVEVEFRTHPELGINGWQIVPDGSLRRNGYEFISDPKTVAETLASVDTLFNHINNLGAIESPRTSIHVHANCLDMTWGQWLSCITAYWMLEEFFLAFAGKHRKGNLFCLGAEEAAGGIYRLTDSFHRGARTPADGGYKYAALNTESINTHGTLEFRAFGGDYNIRRFTQWLTSVDTLMTNASQFRTPREILNYYEDVPNETFVARLMGTGGIPYNHTMNYKLETNYSQLLFMVMEAENLVERQTKAKENYRNVEV